MNNLKTSFLKQNNPLEFVTPKSESLFIVKTLINESLLNELDFHI